MDEGVEQYDCLLRQPGSQVDGCSHSDDIWLVLLSCHLMVGRRLREVPKACGEIASRECDLAEVLHRSYSLKTRARLAERLLSLTNLVLGGIQVPEAQLNVGEPNPTTRLPSTVACGDDRMQRVANKRNCVLMPSQHREHCRVPHADPSAEFSAGTPFCQCELAKSRSSASSDDECASIGSPNVSLSFVDSRILSGLKRRLERDHGCVEVAGFSLHDPENLIRIRVRQRVVAGGQQITSEALGSTRVVEGKLQQILHCRLKSFSGVSLFTGVFARHYVSGARGIRPAFTPPPPRSPRGAP